MRVSKHAIERFKERDINPVIAKRAIQSPKRIQQMPNGTVRYWSMEENLAVVVDHKTNTIVTVMRKEW